MLGLHCAQLWNGVALKIPARLYITETANAVDAFTGVDDAKFLSRPVHQHRTQAPDLVIAPLTSTPDRVKFTGGLERRFRVRTEKI